MSSTILILLLVVPSWILAETIYAAVPLRRQVLRNFDHVHLSLEKDPDNTFVASIRPELFLEKIVLSPNENTTCERDLNRLISAASRRELWALKVFDAWGKPLPSGLLKGNIFWLGNYDECVDQLYEIDNKSFVQQPFDTQYCKSTLFHVDLRTNETCCI